jgi:hypothetical protein
MREQDLAVARDLRRFDASVMLVGQNVPEDSAGLVLQLPAIPWEWQSWLTSFPRNWLPNAWRGSREWARIRSESVLTLWKANTACCQKKSARRRMKYRCLNIVGGKL